MPTNNHKCVCTKQLSCLKTATEKHCSRTETAHIRGSSTLPFPGLCQRHPALPWAVSEAPYSPLDCVRGTAAPCPPLGCTDKLLSRKSALNREQRAAQHCVVFPHKLQTNLLGEFKPQAFFTIPQRGTIFTGKYSKPSSWQ